MHATYAGYGIPTSAEVVALTRVPVCDNTGGHLYDHCTLHVKVPPDADWGPLAAPVPKVTSQVDFVTLVQLRAAVREACAGAAYCRMKTLYDHVAINADRFRALSDLTYDEMTDLALKHLTVTGAKGDFFVG